MAPEKPKRIPNISIEGARILFRNFSGKAGKYNDEGERNFNVIIPPEIIDSVIADGWNVKWLEPREEGDERTPRLEVKVKFTNRPPKLVLITKRGRTTLGEDEIGLLDWAEIKNVDVIINPSRYDFNGRQGISAYLQSIYVTIEEDEFEAKYADVPDSAKNSMATREGENPDWMED